MRDDSRDPADGGVETGHVEEEPHPDAVPDAREDGGATPVDAGAPGGAQPSVAIGAGLSTCIIVFGGAVRCWGNNGVGQLGGGGAAGEPTNLATKVSLPAPAVQIVQELGHTCALLSDSRVFCWGDGHSHLLGRDFAEGVPPWSSTPIEIAGAKGATEIASGGAHDCVRIDGAVSCWGANYFGQLGDGTTTEFGRGSAISRTVPGLPAATAQLALGFNHTCARLVTGQVACWGRNLFGTLAQPESVAHSVVPLLVPGISDALDISAGAETTCVRHVNGKVSCWGLDFEGGPTRWTPTELPRLEGARVVALGEYMAAAVLADGDVVQWGHIHSGVSDPYTVPLMSAEPVPLGGVRELQVGSQHACARTYGDTVWCWGDGLDGWIGNEAAAGELTPKTPPL